MRETLFYQPNISRGNTFLDPEESRHCIKVLRYGVGDMIQILDGGGKLYTARITRADHKQCEFEIVEEEFHNQPPYYIHIAIAPTKNTDRIEWFVEKAVEIGIQEISFLLCDNSERKVQKTDRIRRKAINAMKQSRQYYLPKINEMQSFSQVLPICNEEVKCIAYVDFANPQELRNLPPEKSYCVLIGPEGDFSEAELEVAIAQNFQKVSLGPSRLRTETAGIVACHLLNLING